MMLASSEEIFSGVCMFFFEVSARLGLGGMLLLRWSAVDWQVSWIGR
jgi:hypothetical protein